MTTRHSNASSSSTTSFRLSPALLAVFLLALLTTRAHSSSADDWYVDIHDPNCPSGTGGPGDPFCNVGDAVSVAAAGDTIYIAAGVYPENLVLSQSLTLIGEGTSVTILDGSKIDRVFDLMGGNFELRNFSITNGLSGGKGGGVHAWYGTTLTLVNMAVFGNEVSGTSTGSGAGISAVGDLTVINSTVSDNKALGQNGSSGAGISAGASLTLIDSVVSSNEANGRDDARGGGIFAGSSLTIVNSTVSGNEAIGADSALGGGIYAAADVTLLNSTVSGNLIEAADPLYSNANGGGVYTSNGPLVVDNSVIANNIARGPWAHGGGLYKGLIGTATLTESLLTGNQADDHGAGIFNDGGSLSITRCTLSGNTGRNGSGIRNRLGTMDLTWCLVENNNSGPAISTGTNNSTIDRCVIRNNNGNGIRVDSTPGSLTVEDTLIVGNSGNFGGGVYVSTPNLTLRRCTIAGNSAPVYGGGVYASSATQVDHCVIAGNSAPLGPDCFGSLNSLAYNLIGDTTDCTVTGDPTGNLLDVDPLFTNPGSGDYTLQAGSPCVDTGNPAMSLTGRDVADNPRLLDGSLDRVRVLDRGAYEFNHAALAVTGNATPGGSLTIDLTGTAGLEGWLYLGTSTSETPFSRYGTLFVDLTSPYILYSLGPFPASLSGTIPPSTPTGAFLVLQGLGFQLSNAAGNLSNVVELTIE